MSGEQYSDIQYAIFAMERCARGMRAMGARVEAANPDDPYSAVHYYDDAESVEKAVEVLKRIEPFAAPAEQPQPVGTPFRELTGFAPAGVTLSAHTTPPPAAEPTDAQDAARYRWLREHGDAEGCQDIWAYYDGYHLQQGDALDAAIDAALAEQPQPARIDPMQNPLRPTLAKLGPAGEHPAEEVLRKLACWLGVGGYNAPTVDADLFHRKIVDGIEMLLASTAPPAAAPSGWIACDERMPEAGAEVLVWLAAPAFKGGSHVVMDTWDEQHEAPVAWSSATLPIGMGWDSGTDWERITHWMPLPAAPGAAPPPAAPQPEAHPVAWMVYTQDGQSVYVTDNPADIKPGQRALPLYTSPQPINKGE